jgi:predicted alpha/beta hydrolase family esterase
VLKEPTARIDPEQTVLAGHSFGGMTTCHAASQLKRTQIKAVWVVDPWMFAFCDQFSTGKLSIDVPVIVISSERFHPQVGGFNSWETTKSILTHCK